MALAELGTELDLALAITQCDGAEEALAALLDSLKAGSPAETAARALGRGSAIGIVNGRGLLPKRPVAPM
jgi:hypothetical protein